MITESDDRAIVVFMTLRAPVLTRLARGGRCRFGLRPWFLARQPCSTLRPFVSLETFRPRARFARAIAVAAAAIAVVPATLATLLIRAIVFRQIGKIRTDPVDRAIDQPGNRVGVFGVLARDN